jgi:hypothetical protein
MEIMLAFLLAASENSPGSHRNAGKKEKRKGVFMEEGEMLFASVRGRVINLLDAVL